MTDEVPANPTGADDGPISVDQAAERFRGMLGQDEATDETNARGNAQVEGAEPEEEAEAESPEPTETPESDEDSELEEKQPRYTVKVNGEERRVTLEEMKKNHMFEADYRQKTSKLADERKVLEAERAHYAEQLKVFVPALQVQFQDKFANVNWVELSQTDPAKYVALRAEADQAAMRLNQAISEQKRIEDQTTAQRQAEYKDRVQQEAAKLAEAIPGYADPEKGKVIRAELKSFLTQEGYSAEEIGGLADHRAAKIAWKAAQYDKAQKAKALAAKQGVQQNIPKVQKPGNVTRVDPKSAAVSAAQERFGKSGRVEDLATLLRARGV